MPVHCARQGEKWRIVHKDGTVAMTSKGNPADGGGHSAQSVCQKQARAMNMHSSAVVLTASSLLCEATDKAHTFRKELIYVGDFEKGDFHFSVDESTLYHWKNTFDRMASNGVEVPVPIEHTTDPEKRRGTVLELEVGVNSHGLPALFGLIEFRDEEAARLATTAQVSVYVPPSWKDGKGNEYVRPIRHVALTDYPVIPKLDGFEAIAASFTLSSEEKEPMKLTELAGKLGLKMQTDETEDDEKVAAAILSKFSKLSDELSALKKSLKAQDGEGGGDMDKDKDKDKDGEGGTTGVAASMLGILRDNRVMKMSALVQDGRLSKAAMDDFVAEYCSDDALTVALSTEAGDNFEAVLAACAKNEKDSRLQDKTKEQVTLSLDPKDNPLIANAEARAAAAK